MIVMLLAVLLRGSDVTMADGTPLSGEIIRVHVYISYNFCLYNSGRHAPQSRCDELGYCVESLDMLTISKSTHMHPVKMMLVSIQ